MKYNLVIAFLFISLSLLSQEKGATPIPSAVDRPPSAETFAVVVGISDYRHERIPDLNFAHKDAEAFVAYLKSPSGGSLPAKNIMVLTNEKATTGQMYAALDWLIEECQPGDKAIIYFSGHGDVETVTRRQRGFLLTHDSPPNNYRAGAYAIVFLQDVIETLSLDKGAQVIMISDACRAGKLAGSNVNGTQATSATLAQQFANEIKILSCHPEEFSLEGEQWGGGRGCFSYHLLEGLYGLADKNRDEKINLLELGRYLEDKVTAETAPHSQIPMTVGSKAVVLADVDKVYLEKILTDKKGQRPILAGIESKGMEDLILEKADSNIQELYQEFLTAIENGNLMEPEGKSANDFYEILRKEKSIEKLHGFMRRNFAAALQDESQKAINDYLETNKNVFEKRNKLDSSYFRFPKYLNKAAKLLGEEHYMYHNLKAKEYYFRGLLVRLKREFIFRQTGREWDTIETNQALDLQFKALEFDSQSAFINHEIALLYRAKGNQKKALEYTSKSSTISPAWGLTIFYHANDLSVNGFEKESIPVYKKAIELTPDYSEAYSELGRLYLIVDELDSAMYWMKKAIEVDTNRFWNYGNLALLYDQIGDYENYEYYSRKMYEKSGENVAVQSISLQYLSIALAKQNKYKEAMEIQKMIFENFPINFNSYYSYACLLSILNKKEEALLQLETAIQKGYNDYEHIQKDTDLNYIRNSLEFETLMKKYLLDQHKD